MNILKGLIAGESVKTGIPGSVWHQIGINFLTSGRGLTVGVQPIFFAY